MAFINCSSAAGMEMDEAMAVAQHKEEQLVRQSHLVCVHSCDQFDVGIKDVFTEDPLLYTISYPHKAMCSFANVSVGVT